MSLITATQPRNTTNSNSNNNNTGNGLITTGTVGNFPSTIAKLSSFPSRLLSSSNDKTSTTTTTTMSPSSCHNQMSIIRPLMEIVDGKTLHHGDILGPIPNLFKWLQSELNRVEKNLEISPMVKSSSNTIVELALTKEEQNMEIVSFNDLYYFEVIRSFRIQQNIQTNQFMDNNNKNLITEPEKPKAWFCKEIEERISSMRPAQTWLNGKELFCCLMCNHFSFYSNHLMLHIMFDCPKKIQQQNPTLEQANKNRAMDIYNKFETSINDKSQQQRKPQQIRSFDIMSLLNSSNKANQNNESEQSTPEETQIIVDVDDNINNDNEEEVDVETLDSNEDENNHWEKILLSHHHTQQLSTANNLGIMTNNKTNNKRNHHLDIGHSYRTSGQQQFTNLYQPPLSSNKSEPIRNRNYQNSKRYKNGNKMMSSIDVASSSSSNGGGNKSAFKKLKNGSNYNGSNGGGGGSGSKKLESLHNHKAMVINGAGVSNAFISNLSNLPYLYNKIAEQSIANNHNNNNHSKNGSNNNQQTLFPTFCAEFLRTNNTGNNGQQQQPNQDITTGQTNKIQKSENNHYPLSLTNGQESPKLSSNTKTCTILSPGPSSSSNLAINSPTNSPPLSDSSRCSSTSASSNSPIYHSTDNNNNRNGKKESKTMTNATVTSGEDGESSSSSMIQLLPQSAQNSMANNPLFNLPPYFMPPTSAAASNPLITSLYLLSPSLTALSYQASNVCAYCNTAFRMTSDLVYHMRSHHKRTKATDELVNKKRRDDQLRCHICNETFRERHHLTRHMTSHQ